jgi:ectoine hydroxylase-related dioxygenase (phytanoyl-CoA dioxygenase family)
VQAPQKDAVLERRVAADTPLSADERLKALSSFTKLGFLQVDAVFPPPLLTGLHAEFVRSHRSALSERADTVSVGDRRFMTTVALDGPFNDPGLYASAAIMTIVNDVLGGEATLASVCAVTALEGAAAQDLHADYPLLFPETALSSLMPAFAVTLIVPLVPLGPGAGTTAVWLGSHRHTGPERLMQRAEDAFVPETALGSAYLMDYRLAHRGMANTTGALRPVLSMVYARPWFLDAVNFVKIPPLRMSAAARGRVPAEWESLFARIPHHGL